MGSIRLQASTGKNASSLKTVVVSADRARLRNQVKSTQMGLVDLPINLLKKAPALAGEVDIIKALQLTPGVKRGKWPTNKLKINP